MSSSITTLVLQGPLDVNAYLLENGGHCLIIDPGFEKERLQQVVQYRNLIVDGILLTHGHFDHTSALDVFPVPIYLHEAETIFLANDQWNGYAEFGIPRPWDLQALSLIKLRQGDYIPFQKNHLEVLHTPGHTPGSVCYRWENNLFSGDTLFKDAVGRWDLPGGDAKALRQSVLSLIETLDSSITVYPGHGEATTIGRERQLNVYYRQWKKDMV
ncbi:MAG: MBL fold metallo-hydrolase [Treponemataceae bacterium]|nr:MBL fold metallo-hydrolase [Treponemataceae bacterium]